MADGEGEWIGFSQETAMGWVNGVWIYDDWGATRLYDADILRCYGVDGDGNPIDDSGRIYEENGTRQETYTPTDFSAHMSFICPWAQRYNYQNNIMGSVYNAHPPVNNYGEPDFSTVGVCSYFSHYYPAQVTQITVTNIGAEGVQVVTQGNAPPTFQPYTMARIAVDYKGRARPGNVNLQQTVTPSFNMRQLPSWGYYWRADGSPVLDQEAPGLKEVQVTIQRHLSGIRRIPNWFYYLAGCVNYNPWQDQLTGMSYLPGTLLFIPSSMDRRVTMARDDDDYCWDISYEISWNPAGWNNFRRPKGIDCMMYDGQAVYHYTERVFPTLLVDPNAAGMEQMLGDPYRVHLVDDEGVGYYIGVRLNGEVVQLTVNEFDIWSEVA